MRPIALRLGFTLVANAAAYVKASTLPMMVEMLNVETMLRREAPPDAVMGGSVKTAVKLIFELLLPTTTVRSAKPEPSVQWLKDQPPKPSTVTWYVPGATANEHGEKQLWFSAPFSHSVA